jgi:hypothetical protein
VVEAGAVLALGLGTYIWSVLAGTSKPDPAAGSPRLSVVPATGKCVVSYAVWADSKAKGEFSAKVTLANRDDTAIDNWKLWFILPGDQTVTGNGSVQMIQTNNTVTVSSTDALEPLKTVSIPITGKYAANNSAPLAFMLNNRTCETFVSSAPGEPVRQVEHLSDGGVRLSPSPSSSTPVPGVSIDPTGGVHITPTTAPTTGPTTAPTTAATTLVTAEPTITIEPSLPGSQGPTTQPTTAPTTAPTTENTTAPADVTTPPTAPEDCDTADPTCTLAPST